ncbi:MAG: HAD hydrolase-like protein [Candidatus Omnitrophica bacterium]|nr:HAD hydrolase-like protein [Candidatus Omnitrophota bacterium]MDD5488418.1 HAD hydrolase-like protein [Candidatus Omnitrophota bacterium]
MGKERPGVIFFDLGNVIVKVHEDKLEEGYSRHAKFKPGDILEYFRTSREVKSYAEGKISSSQFFARTRRRFRMDVKFGEFYGIWNGIFSPEPGTEDVIRGIRSAYPDVKLVLVSDTNEAHFEYIKVTYPVLNMFDGYVLSYKVGKLKPHHAMFTEALRVAGSKPRDSFYTDDREDLIAAARVMGIKAFVFVDAPTLKRDLSRLGFDL